jgi:hypothetical protein
MTPIASIDPRTAAVNEVVAQESATPDVGQQRLAVVEARDAGHRQRRRDERGAHDDDRHDEL